MSTVLSLSDAVLARLKATSGFVTYDAEIPTTPAGAYVVLYPELGNARAERMSDTRSRLDWACYVVCVGRTRKQAVNTADLARAALTGWRPTDDRAASPLNETTLDAPIVPDRSVLSDIRYSLTLRYTHTSPRS